MEIHSEEPARYGQPLKQADCPFCAPDFAARAIDRVDDMLVIPDRYPVTAGHLLLVPVEHYTDFFALPEDLRRIADLLLIKHRSRILTEDPLVTGFNVGMNCGVSAGQTVMHAHIHLIPRREGDTPQPRGGVRGCVPDKMVY